MYVPTFAIGTYMPSLAHEQIGKAQDQLAVADGRNFAWTPRGVFSAHGGVVVTAPVGAASIHPHAVVIKDIQHVITDGKVHRIEPDLTLTEVFSFTADWDHPVYDLSAYPWTQAYVGTRHWFCQPRFGLIYYDEFEDRWGRHREDCWIGPAFAITHADNRLVVLLEDALVWSRFDQGHLYNLPDSEDYIDDWRSGSGAQSLALARYGQPYSVMPYNNGWITFTSMGILVSTPNFDQLQDPSGDRITVGAVVYQHKLVNADDMPVGPTAICHVDEAAVIWLSRRGFQQFAPTQGGGFGAVQDWQPAMGQFYAEILLQNEEAGWPIDSFNLTYARECGWLFVSSRTEPALPFYDRAHCYQLDLDRWGSFDHEHLAFGWSTRQGQHRAGQEWRPGFYGYFTPARRLISVNHKSGNPASFVRFSPVRLQLPQEDVPPSTVISVQSIRVGCAGPGGALTTPAHLSSSWRQEQETTQRISSFDVFISAGDDAETQNVDEGEYAQLVSRDRQSALYSCHATGIAHSLVISALRADQHFDLRHIEIGFFWAGIK